MKTIRFSRLAPLALFLLCLAAPWPVRGQVVSKIYAKFSTGTGNWAGPLKSPPSRVGWVELSAMSFGANNTVAFTGGGTSTGKSTFKDIVFTKEVDRLTPQIFASLTSGTAIPYDENKVSVIVEFVGLYAGNETVFMRLEYKSIYFTLQTAAPAGGQGEAIPENVTMQAGAIRMTWWPVDPSGVQGTAIQQSWSVITNSTSF